MPAESDRLLWERHIAELAGVRNRLRDEIAGLTAELEDRQAITRALFSDLNRTLDAIRDALTHIDAGEFGIARRALQAVLERTDDARRS